MIIIIFFKFSVKKEEIVILNLLGITIEEIEIGEMKGMIGTTIIVIMMIVGETIEEWMIEEIERGEMKGIFPYVTGYISKCNCLIKKTLIFLKLASLEKKKKYLFTYL